MESTNNEAQDANYHQMNVVLTPSTFQRAPQNEMQNADEQLELLIQIVKEHQTTIK